MSPDALPPAPVPLAGWRRRAPLLVGLWTIVGLALAFLDRPLTDALWLTVLALWGAYAVLGLALLVALFHAASRTHWHPTLVGSAVTLLTLALLMVLAVPRLAGAGDEFFFARRFRRLRPQYERILKTLAAVGAVQTDSVRRAGEIDFYVDSGPPLRAAFLQPGGILDNWEGVVYDPTNAVATATGWRDRRPGEFTAAPNVLKLFGGDLVRCVHVDGPFYRCWFTGPPAREPRRMRRMKRMRRIAPGHVQHPTTMSSRGAPQVRRGTYCPGGRGTSGHEVRNLGSSSALRASS